MRLSLIIFLLILLVFSAASARIVEEPLQYDHNGAQLEGIAVYDEATENKRPALILFHDWRGPGEIEIALAREYVGLGYIVFVADMYGKDVRPTTAAEAADATRELYADRDFFRKRAYRAYDAFTKEYWIADVKRVACMGTAFGGTSALELARTGARLAGTIAVNASIRPASEDDGRKIQGRVLVLHADSDPYIASDELHEFIDEMRAGDVDYELIIYGRAQRGFTNPDAPVTVHGSSYDPELAEQARETIDRFLEQVFASEQ
ncbi:dienelactone hydrolase family protein [bacterium BMS3Bbin04]|nr:dienelactone hydrolase family protein [bacterium BMS3Bbin04]